MRITLFCHSLISDWNHGNAHFLRGVATDLIERGHDVDIYEPVDSWSLANLLADQGNQADQFRAAYPLLSSTSYHPDTLDLDTVLAGTDLVIVHEWNSHELVARIGEHRAAHDSYKLLFHDTHHRSVTDPSSMSGYDLEHYDGVLAFGGVIRDLYLARGWAKEAWTWHEAADTRVFHPIDDCPKLFDLVWVGNWGDNERTAELQEFLLEPVKRLGLRAKVYGVRYPPEAIAALSHAGIEYGGYLANYEAPSVFSQAMVTVHVPRRPYVRVLPGVPTIRVFEALACGIPLISAPWKDTEGLFSPGDDFLVAENGKRMAEHLAHVLASPLEWNRLSEHGQETINSRHTCTHRVDELLKIYEELT